MSFSHVLCHFLFCARDGMEKEIFDKMVFDEKVSKEVLHCEKDECNVLVLKSILRGVIGM